jgi:hypothetical protein
MGLLHKIQGRGYILRTSLYADDAEVFVAPIREDIQNLTAILERFGEVTSLRTNFQKSFVVPIRCGQVDIDSILDGVPAARASFALRYPGLPLSVRCLKRVDFKHLEDKCVGKLPTWNGKYVTTAGRSALIKCGIASQPIYHLTSLNIPPETISSSIRSKETYFGPPKILPPALGVRSIGRWCAALRSLEALEFFTWENLARRLGFVRLGGSERIPTRFGSDTGTHAIRRIWKSSMPPPALLLATEGRPLFGMHHR